ncbi:hypothetical protein [Methylophaga sp.]|uniref:hypothetical protein n=1 Tax=Methylophaga sp. TaxID=2024840 RepID=UPI003F69FD16
MKTLKQYWKTGSHYQSGDAILKSPYLLSMTSLQLTSSWLQDWPEWFDLCCDCLSAINQAEAYG